MKKAVIILSGGLDSACMVAQKKMSTSSDPDKARKFCEEKIKKQIK